MMQHIHLVHSESTESPNGPDEASTNYNERGQNSNRGAKYVSNWEGAISAAADSSDYIACHCGEYCMLSEFDDHLEMHNAEGTYFDANESVMTNTKPALPTVQRESASTSASNEHTQDNTQQINLSSKPVPIIRSSFIGSRSSHDSNYDSQDRASGLGSEAVISRKRPGTSQHTRKVVRLGVSIRSSI